MNTYAQYELRLTDHAYERYLERVGSQERETLQQWLAERIQKQNYRVDSEFIQIDDIWWAFAIKNDVMSLVTCYGRTMLDLPRAVIWAKRHRDNINLNELLEPDYGTTS